MAKATKEQSVKETYTVVSPFIDSEIHAAGKVPERHDTGKDVSHFDDERLASLVERGLVTKK